MTSNLVKKDHIVDLLEAEWSAIADFCENLSEEQWLIPTQCPGWSVKDNISHILGTERALSGQAPPENESIQVGNPAHVKNEIARMNECWIEERRGRAGSEVLSEFREVTAGRIGALRAMSQDDFDAPSWTPAGNATYGRFMQIRLFDSWTHEQDIREALGMKGHLLGSVVDEVMEEVKRSMGFVVGKLGGAPADSRVEFSLTGDREDLMRLECSGDGKRFAVVADFAPNEAASEADEETDSEANITITLDFALFMRMTAGRVDNAEAVADGKVSVEGDTEAGKQIAENLAYVF